MLTLIYKSILLIFGILLLGEGMSAEYTVAVFLAVLILTSLNQYFKSRYFTEICSLVYIAASMLYPVLFPFLPLMCFDLFLNGRSIIAVSAVIPLYMNMSETSFRDLALIAIMIVLSTLMRYIYGKVEHLTEENKRIRDTSTELNRMLEQKNENLTERHDYEVHLATLKERNRIAREIHDNVGHILSRSILQTGALLATNKDARVAEQLTGLKDTLSLAMDSIRGSVHDLRDDSIDLYEAVSKMTMNLPYEIDFDYDIETIVPNNIKYCILSVLKEALTNITKHSDAGKIRITLLEHPAMFQLLIHDNGTKIPPPGGGGMGLSNMEERVRSLGGQFSTGYKDGFRIFVSIPIDP